MHAEFEYSDLVATADEATFTLTNTVAYNGGIIADEDLYQFGRGDARTERVEQEATKSLVKTERYSFSRTRTGTMPSITNEPVNTTGSQPGGNNTTVPGGATTTNNSGAATGGGCGGSIAATASVAVLAAVGAAGFYVFRRRDEEEFLIVHYSKSPPTSGGFLSLCLPPLGKALIRAASRRLIKPSSKKGAPK